MVRPLRAIAWTLVAALAALPASAAIYTIQLKSGDSFESRYAPKDASWDPQKVVFVDEVGNLIAIGKSDIDTIKSDIESAGYGHMLDDTTMMLGRAPNDAPEPGTPAAERAAQQGAEPAAGPAAEPIYEPNASPPTMQVLPASTPGGNVYVTAAPAPEPPPSEPPPSR